MRNTCLLCDRDLEPHPDDATLQVHPVADDCLVRLTDLWGVTVEAPTPRQVLGIDSVDDDDDGFDLSAFKHVDQALAEIFGELGLPRLGGQSSGRGWSSISLFQHCPYAWKRRYIEQAKHFLSIESEGRSVGTVMHVHLALHYASMIVDSPYRDIEPEWMHDRLLRSANPKFVNEGWRLFTAHRLFYQLEQIEPLAIEYDLRDPRTGESCRYDLIAFMPEPVGHRPAGTYAFEHKSAQRFDRATLEGWPNDGEVIGQVALWKKLGLDMRFGPLQGVIVNIVGKQKVPEMHRTIVSPTSWQIEDHLRSLRRWEGLLNLARQYDEFPRARAACVGRYGMCEWFDHCATGGTL